MSLFEEWRSVIALALLKARRGGRLVYRQSLVDVDVDDRDLCFWLSFWMIFNALENYLGLMWGIRWVLIVTKHVLWDLKPAMTAIQGPRVYEAHLSHAKR